MTSFDFDEDDVLKGLDKRYQLAEDIADYVKQGGKDAYSFSVMHESKHGHIPGKTIQRMIDDEIRKGESII